MPPGEWLPATTSWWETWAGSQQAGYFTPTAWQRLAMLMPLVDLYFREPSRNLLAEVRLNESKLGATPEDMARLGWKPADDRPAEPPDNLVALYPDVEVEVE